MPLPRSAPPAPPSRPAGSNPPPPPGMSRPQAPPSPPPSRQAAPPPQVVSAPSEDTFEDQEEMALDVPFDGSQPVDQTVAQEEQYPAEQSQGSHAISAQVGGDIIAIAENYGFKGLDLTAFGVLPIVVLKNDIFMVNDGSLRFGEEFYCIIYGGEPKFVYKTDLGEKDPRNDLFYTYDEKYISGSGTSIQTRLAEWKKQGLPYLRKDYIDVRIGVLRDGYDEPLLALLSVPPTSKANYTNIVLQLVNWAKGSGYSPSDRTVRVFKGPVVQKVKHPFYPIKFEMMPQ